MSRRYSATVTGAAGPAAGAAFAELRNSASRRLHIHEVGVFVGAATVLGVGLVRATAQGTGGAASGTGQAEDGAAPAATATGLFVSAFTVAPTFTAANALKRARIPAAIGNGLIWTWPEDSLLIVPVSSSLVLYNAHTAAGAAAFDVYVAWSEG